MYDNQFTGWWIPADIVEMFQEGEISARELLLLATIDGLVKHGKRGLGCFASNETLAKMMHLKNPITVANMIVRLKRMGLLRLVKFDGRRRYLETKWSRVRTTKDRSR